MITFHAKPITGWDLAIEAHRAAAVEKAELILEKVGEAITEWLVGLTIGEQGWKNVTGALEQGYKFHVDPQPTGARLILRNDDWKAAIIEARDGMFVLAGVLDPGGPVEQKLVEVAAEFAPEWEVVRAG